MKRPLIIHRPDLQYPQQRVFFSFLTLLAWMLWVYLIMPVFSLLAWIFGIQLFGEQVLSPLNGQHFMSFSMEVLQVIVVLGMFLMAWSQYNYRRFSYKQRRRHVPDTRFQQVADHFKVTLKMLEKAHNVRRMTIHLVEDGSISSIEISLLDEKSRLEFSESEWPQLACA